MTAPELTRRDLESSLTEMLSVKREHFLIAFHGRGADDRIEIDGQTVQIIAVRSELDLRRRLLDISRDELAAFLIPWQAPSLPIDLRGRFARGGAIKSIGRGPRLQATFSASALDDATRDSPLAEYILARHPDQFADVGGRLTVDVLWTSWLSRIWGLDAGELALDTLLGWAALDGRGPKFATTMADDLGKRVHAALIEHLRDRLGATGVLVWKAWLAGRGQPALELAIVLGAIGATDNEGVKVWRSMTAAQVFDEKIDDAILTRLGETADAALRFLARPGAGNESAIRTIVNAANRRASDSAIVAHVIGSSRLQVAWQARLDRLGIAVAGVVSRPDAETLRVAREAWLAVWKHDAGRDMEHRHVLRRAEMALRLASWLVARPDRELAPSPTPYGDVEALATWYAREGGYLDLARRWVRGPGGTPFGDGANAVVRAVDTIRVELDRKFAAGLPGWHTASRPSRQVVPIDKALSRIATAFLDEDPERKLLVILMDGMSWSQAVELLESMGSRGSVWGPLAWHGISKNRIGDGAVPAVLTNFPTITEVSRSAFFGGKSIAAGTTPDASKDPEKWKTNPDVKKHVHASSVPMLHLRGEGQSKDGSATPEAIQLVMNPQQRIAGIVINAIDMSLKADRTHEIEWRLDNVKALRELLDKASEVGRAVLLCSDHGHVPADRFGSGLPQRDGARWRVWKAATDPIGEFEVGLPAGDGVWAPRGAHGIAMITDDAHRHGGGTGAGEHGGASLAEVVAPCVLIGCADSYAAAHDSAQAVRPVSPPSWWFYDVGEGRPEGAEDPAERKPKRTPKKVSTDQQVMPMFAPPPVPEPAAPEPPRSTESRLAKSELFAAKTKDVEAKLRETCLRAVEVLHKKKGVVSVALFASELGAFPTRVQGLVSNLQGILNIDGYQVIRMDKVNQQVHLDIEKLEQQFEVELG